MRLGWVLDGSNTSAFTWVGFLQEIKATWLSLVYVQVNRKTGSCGPGQHKWTNSNETFAFWLIFIFQHIVKHEKNDHLKLLPFIPRFTLIQAILDHVDSLWTQGSQISKCLTSKLVKLLYFYQSNNTRIHLIHGVQQCRSALASLCSCLSTWMPAWPYHAACLLHAVTN